MDFKKLNNQDKQQLFEFIAALAITAGQEMSEEGYRVFNASFYIRQGCHTYHIIYV